MVKTKFELMSLLFDKNDDRPAKSFSDSSGVTHTGWLHSIQREDGSGRSFNVTIGAENDGVNETFHMRTID